MDNKEDLNNKVNIAQSSSKSSAHPEEEKIKKEEMEEMEEPDYEPEYIESDFTRRVKATKKTRWVRFGLVSLVFFAWVVLMGNPWLALLWLLLFDIYITGYIPFTWWKKRTGITRTVMAWVDAIVYALVLIYFIFAFVGQQYEIPSSSLEKSLLVGDRLWVDKTVYGARVPQTPLHFPLAQHTLPFFNSKSYIESPQLEYHRLPGRRSVERGDIVVFNYPQGDSVAPGLGTADYYMVSEQLRKEGIKNPKAYLTVRYGDVIWRPVDRRENYVKRAIGLPGERLKIVNDTVYINGVAIAEPENVQYNYIVPVSSPISDERWHELGVRAEDHALVGSGNPLCFAFYNVPLTRAMIAEITKWPEVSGPLRRESESGLFELGGMFPAGANYGWTRPDMGELWIPKRGSTLHLTLNNLPIYRRAIEVYEGNKVDVKENGRIYINDKPGDYYTFKMDYYWMMGDNRDRSADSRYWGFVPEDHIVGSPVTVLVSLDEEVSLTNGKIRWNRILSNPNPDKDAKKW